MTDDLNGYFYWAVTKSPTTPRFRPGKGFVSTKNVIDSSTMREDKELDLQREALKIVRSLLAAETKG